MIRSLTLKNVTFRSHMPRRCFAVACYFSHKLTRMFAFIYFVKTFSIFKFKFNPCVDFLDCGVSAGLSVGAAWIAGQDRSMWRTLRPSAGQAQQWVSEWGIAEIIAVILFIVYFFYNRLRYSRYLDKYINFVNPRWLKYRVTDRNCWHTYNTYTWWFYYKRVCP